jgi:hypothetical protein
MTQANIRSSQITERIPEVNYLDQCRHVLAILAEKPEARLEFQSTLAAFSLDNIFPPQIYSAARWILSSTDPISPGMLIQKFGLDLSAEVAALHPADLAQSAVAVDAFLDVFRREQLRVLGFNLPPEAGVADQLAKLMTQLTALAQARRAEDDPRGKERLARFIETRRDSASMGYRQFGIPQIDANYMGLDFLDGDLMLIFEQEKSWKTRLALNLVLRLLIAYPDIVCSWLSTEPMVSPEKLAAKAWAMCAVRQASLANKRNFDISFINLLSPAPEARVFVDEGRELAEEILQRMYIYGPAFKDGNAANLDSALSILVRDISTRGTNLVVIDNFQQFSVRSRVEMTDYDLMLHVTRMVTSLLSQHAGVVCIGISQASQQGRIKGGGGMPDRLSFAVKTKFDPIANQLKMSCEYARDGASGWDELIPAAPFAGWLRV